MGVTIFFPMDSPIGIILGLLAIFAFILFFLSILGSIFKNVFLGIGVFLGIINEKEDLWYHKKDKSYGIAFLWSLFLPFSGNLYLKENKLSLISTLLSISIIIVTIWGLLTIPDFYYNNDYVVKILIGLWLISLISLGINIRQYNKYKENYPSTKKTDFPFFDNKILIIIPILVFILFLSVNMMVMNDTSNRIYENANYTLEYPHDYIQDGNVFHKKESNSRIRVIVEDAGGNSLEEWKDKISHSIVRDKGTISVDGVEGNILEDYNSVNYMFVKNDKLYLIVFEDDTYKDNATILNSFKFK